MNESSEITVVLQAHGNAFFNQFIAEKFWRHKLTVELSKWLVFEEFESNW
jgi:hypothetical protein